MSIGAGTGADEVNDDDDDDDDDDDNEEEEEACEDNTRIMSGSSLSSSESSSPRSFSARVSEALSSSLRRPLGPGQMTLKKMMTMRMTMMIMMRRPVRTTRESCQGRGCHC